MRIRFALAVAVLICSTFASTRADAGPYGDELSKCLITSTTPADRNDLIKWMFYAMAQHPEVKVYSKLSEEQGDEMIRSTASLFEKLITELCLSQAKAVVEFEGPNALSISFKTLGEVAARGLFTHPDVAAYSAGLEGYVDQANINAKLGIQ